MVTNGVGSPGSRPTTFASTNSTLRLNITGITNIFCANLVSGGLTNLISPDSVAVFASYPKQIVLVKFTSQFGAGVTNFGLTDYPVTPLQRIPLYPLRQPLAAAIIAYHRLRDALGFPA